MLFRKLNYALRGILNKVKLLFNRNLTANFRNLFIARIALNSGTLLVSLFLPIFLYKIFGFNLAMLIFFYISLDLPYALLIVPACQNFMNKVGIKNSLRFSIFFGALYYFSFLLIDQVSNGALLIDLKNYYYLLPAIVFFTIFRLTHWTPYHTNISKLTERHIRASQVGLMEAVILITGALMPILAGIMLEYLGFSSIFIATIILFLSSFPFFSRLPEVKEKFTWTYKETWKKLFSKKMRPVLLANLGDGAEGMVGAIIWPVFIWELLKGNFFQVGAISSIVILVTVLTQGFVGEKLSQLGNKRRFLRFGVFFYATGWILKALISSAFHVFLFSTYHNLSRIFSHTSFDTLNYDIADKQGPYVDEYTVLKEIAVSLGKISMSLLILLLYPFISLKLSFLLAAIASLSMSFLKQSEVSSS